jgi:hypothetical protein
MPVGRPRARSLGGCARDDGGVERAAAEVVDADGRARLDALGLGAAEGRDLRLGDVGGALEADVGDALLQMVATVVSASGRRRS